MQRKNSILKRSRNGMALIMAIAVVVIISTIMALALSLTSQTTKRTADMYLYEQSVLLAKSATEYALLKIAQDGPCMYTGHTFLQDIFTITLNVKYVYYDNPATGVNEVPVACTTAVAGTLYTSVQTPAQDGSVLIDVSVSVTDTTVAPEPIRYFRRTIQKL